jgi:hypothetical protein
MYVQIRKIGEQNNLKVFGNNNTKEPKQVSKTYLEAGLRNILS